MLNLKNAHADQKHGFLQTEENFKALVQNSSDVISVLDPRGVVIYTSPSIKQILGWEHDELIGKNGFDYVHPDDRARLLNIFLETSKFPHQTVKFEYRFLHKNQNWIDLEGTGTNKFNSPEVGGMIVNSRQISDVLQKARELDESQKLLKKITDTTANVIAIFDLVKNEVKYVNAAIKKTLGYDIEELLNLKFEDLAGLSFLDKEKISFEVIKNKLTSVQADHNDELEVMVRHKNGYPRKLKLFYSAFKRDADGAITEVLCTFEDITKQKEIEQQLINQALFDSLTGLPNRHHFMTQLDYSIATKVLKDKEKIAVLFIDLDKFKIINDSLGHEIGDQLLIAVSNRLKNCVRDIDFVARLGGDEFTVIVSNVQDVKKVDEVAIRIQKELQKPIQVLQNTIHITVSIGIAISNGIKTKSSDIVRNADTAMYKAKEEGRNCFKVFDQGMHKELIMQLKLEEDLMRAVDRNQMELEFQPIYDLNSLEIVAYESLVRWRHPKKGLLAPDKFLAAAEEIGSILHIDKWVLEKSFEVQSSLNARHSRNLKMHLNLSSSFLKQGNSLRILTRLMNKYGIQGSQICLEFAEKSLLENIQDSKNKLNQMKHLGIEIAIDNFGTGYSSLTYLRDLPISKIKIDRTILKEIETSEESRAISESLVILAKNLKLSAVAEGIDTLEKLEILKSQHYHYGQGFFLNKPKSLSEFNDLLSQY